MSKKSIIVRNNKRKEIVKKFYKIREKIKKDILSKNSSYSDKWKLILKLQKFPRDSIPSRIRNRCYETGRPRGYLRKFGLSRIKFRELAVQGLIPGLKKSSW